MQKTAQSKRQTGRGIFNKLREMTNVSGLAAEKFFDPQLKDIMEKLREVDNAVRSIATGKSIEGGDPGSENTSLKDLLKSAKSNLNRREYMTTVAELGRFHKKITEMMSKFSQLNLKIDEMHRQFLFQDMSGKTKGKEDPMKHLRDLQQRWAEQSQDELIKEAGILDFLHNATDKRGRALAFYEKRFPKEIRDLKKETANLLSRSQDFYAQMIEALKAMASARATRNVNAYVDSFNKVKGKFDVYNTKFKEYYTTQVKPFEKHFAEIVKEIPAEKPAGPSAEMPDANLGKQEIPDLDVPPQQSVPMAQPGEFGYIGLPGGSPLRAPPMPTNLGPPVPERDTDPNMTEPPIESSELEDSNPPRSQTMMGVAPPANRPQTIGYKPMSIIPKPPAIAPANRPGASIPVEGLPPFRAHSQFMESLQSLSQEEPRVLAAYIKKYAQSIQSKDMATAIKLFALVKQITG